jgi:predicted transglutaminase-like cysteine proteinase
VARRNGLTADRLLRVPNAIASEKAEGTGFTVGGPFRLPAAVVTFRRPGTELLASPAKSLTNSRPSLSDFQEIVASIEIGSKKPACIVCARTSGSSLHMRQIVKFLALLAAFSSSYWISYAHATFFGFPRMLNSVRMVFEDPILAPIAHSRFCLQYPEDCKVRGTSAEPEVVVLTESRWTELVSVDREVNRAIAPRRNNGGVWDDQWLISPGAGDCNDYAVTKRHELLARGWPSKSLLLSEVVIPSGEHHLVLAVRTAEGDFVLDNLNANVLLWSQTHYQWLRVQSPRNPKFWSTVRGVTS